MTRLRVLLTLGTRPEAIKMAPVVLECRRRADLIEPIVCFTGQHREMMIPMTEYFGIQPDVDLDLMTPGQTPAGFLARCLAGLDGVLERFQPDCLVAQGDTMTVMAAALSGFYRRIPMVHVEAGLRTRNLLAPWPEEFNRRVASLAATLHCAPTRWAADNLLAEGVPANQVHVTGNTVIDALQMAVERERANAAHWQALYPMLGNRRMVLITGHRRENFGEGFERICDAIRRLAGTFSDVLFLYPTHLNPRVWDHVHSRLAGLANIRLSRPVSYSEFVWLMDRSTLILTDSGGVQEEAPSLGKSVLVMRDTTERPEGLKAGVAELVGTSADNIVRAVSKRLTNPADFARRLTVSNLVNPYGDGHSAARIVELMVSQFVPAHRNGGRSNDSKGLP